MITIFRKSLFVYLCAAFMFYSLPTYKARAFEPVSMSILAALLMPYAEAAASKAIQFMVTGAAKAFPYVIETGLEFLNIFRLPLGVLEVTIGLPFGFLGYGITNIWKGGIAPFMMMVDFFKIPLAFFHLI